LMIWYSCPFFPWRHQSPKTKKTGNNKPIDIVGNWPPYDIGLYELGMDNTQLDALQNILSNEVSIIQGKLPPDKRTWKSELIDVCLVGPPGTGKTFVGTKAMQVLLSNLGNSIDPIVFICQTNNGKFNPCLYDQSRVLSHVFYI
jgi:hypothetical protein